MTSIFLTFYLILESKFYLWPPSSCHTPLLVFTFYVLLISFSIFYFHSHFLPFPPLTTSPFFYILQHTSCLLFPTSYLSPHNFPGLFFPFSNLWPSTSTSDLNLTFSCFLTLTSYFLPKLSETQTADFLISHPWPHTCLTSDFLHPPLTYYIRYYLGL